MRRTLLDRLAHVGLALAFLSGLGAGPYGLRDCPHHSGAGHSHGGAEHGTVSPAPGSGSQAGSAPAEGQRLTSSHDSGEGDGSGEPEGPCTCLGACHAGAVTPLLSAATPVALAAPAGPPLRTAVRSQNVLPESAPYLLPYANAPPLRA